jgi:hypothetical protein
VWVLYCRQTLLVSSINSEFSIQGGLGLEVLSSRGIFEKSYWYWIGVGTLFGYSILFNLLFCFFLKVLDRKLTLLLSLCPSILKTYTIPTLYLFCKIPWKHPQEERSIDTIIVRFDMYHFLLLQYELCIVVLVLNTKRLQLLITSQISLFLNGKISPRREHRN